MLTDAGSASGLANDTAAARGIYLWYTPDVPDIYLACTWPLSVRGLSR
jgi:hypothetical protein